jgi:hypothetical protein
MLSKGGLEMKIIRTIFLGVLTLFFGVYAMVLELKGIKNADQIVMTIIFALLTFWSCESPSRRGG